MPVVPFSVLRSDQYMMTPPEVEFSKRSINVLHVVKLTHCEMDVARMN